MESVAEEREVGNTESFPASDKEADHVYDMMNLQIKDTRDEFAYLDPKSWLAAIRAELKHGNNNKADKLWAKAFYKYPKSGVLWAARIEMLPFDVRNMAFRQALEIVDRDPHIFAAFGKQLWREGIVDQATNRFNLATIYAPGVGDFWVLYYIFEHEHGNEHRSDRKTNVLRRCIDAEPKQGEKWEAVSKAVENAHQPTLEIFKKVVILIGKEVYAGSLDDIGFEEYLNDPPDSEDDEADKEADEFADKFADMNPESWLATIRAELKQENNKRARKLMAKALQECPNSGVLWAAKIEMVPLHLRKKTCHDALIKCDQDPHVIATVGKIFWRNGIVDKARHWLKHAVTLAPDVGDFWDLYYKFEHEHGNEDRKKRVLKRCVAAEPKQGEKWEAVSKAVENAHQPTKEILKKVTSLIGKEAKSC